MRRHDGQVLLRLVGQHRPVADSVRHVVVAQPVTHRRIGSGRRDPRVADRLERLHLADVGQERDGVAARHARRVLEEEQIAAKCAVEDLHGVTPAYQRPRVPRTHRYTGVVGITRSSDAGDTFTQLSRELKNFEDIARNLTPRPGDVPQLQGIDVFGGTLPFNGVMGGDHLIYVDFKQRFDLEARIAAR